MPSFAPPYLVISQSHSGKTYSEVVYCRALIENCTWLHILTADFYRLGPYQATYVTSSGSKSGIYSVFAYEAVGNKWLVKGLFEQPQDGHLLSTTGRYQLERPNRRDRNLGFEM